jgi:hypothetical protein
LYIFRVVSQCRCKKSGSGTAIPVPANRQASK